MKRYNFRTRDLREQDNKIVKFKEELDVLITSEEFINSFRGYIEDIARYKTVNGRKYARSTEYAAIGCLTINDLYQEAYLAFFEAYNNYKNKSDDFEGGAEIWSYLKKSTILNFEKSIRGKKDGIRVPERVLFNDGANTNLLTTLFSQLEKVFFRNQEEVELTKWETDLVGAFLEVHMDDFLDLKANGSRNLKGIERELIKRTYGIDGVKIPIKEFANQYDISDSTARVVKNRALNKLKSKESKAIIADFLHEYRITTKADTEKYRKNETFLEKL